MTSAAPVPDSPAGGDAYSRLISSSTLTYSGYNPSQTLALDTLPATGVNPTLVTATGSSPPPPPQSVTRTTGGTLPSNTGTTGSSNGRGGMSKNVQNLLIALGCAAGFIVILLTFWVWYRARRRTSGRFLAFCMPKRKSDSYYRQLQSPNHGWESRATETSERKPSMQSRSESISPIMTSPTPRTRAVMSPAPARINIPFIGRERNTLVRASLNRHQLSTLDEHSSYEYESEPVVYYTPPPPRTATGTSSPTQGRSLAQQISSSAHQPKPPTPIASLSDNGSRGPPALQLDSNYSVAPLQPRKADLPRQSTRSSWITTATQPVTPGRPPSDYPFPPPDPTVPRFRSVDHWADYQKRMAQRDRSMTSGEYSQAFRDRDSAVDSVVGRRESTSTIAVFRYHPGEEVSMGGGGGAGTGTREVDGPSLSQARDATSTATAGSPVSPSTTNNILSYYEPYRPTYQPFQPARQMHSARNPRAGPRYQSNNNAGGGGTSAGGADPSSSSESSSSSSPSSSIPPSLPDAGESSDSNNTHTNHHRQESEATVFNFHPGQEVMIDRADKIKSEDLDAYFGPPQRSTSNRS